MREGNEQEILAWIRTLCALERNYLAEERTELAEFRTGLALALIGPPASATVIYLSSSIHTEASQIFELFGFIFLAIITLTGIWMTLSSRSALKEIKKKKKILKAQKKVAIKRSQTIHDPLCNLVEFEDQ